MSPGAARLTRHLLRPSLRFDFFGAVSYAYPDSSPFPPSWGRSSAGRALEWHSRGRRFDPDRLHQKINNLDAIEILSVRELWLNCVRSWLLLFISPSFLGLR